MKRIFSKSSLLVISILFAANFVFSQSDKEYKAVIEKLNTEMTKAMLKGDMEKSMSLYTEDAISMPSYEPIHIGLDEIRKSSEMMLKSGVKIISFEPKTLKVISSGKLITEIGTYTISMAIPGMEKVMDDHGKYITIWEKQDNGSLKVKVDTWNSDVNPWGMAGEMKEKEGNEVKVASPTE
jgi:uncharacterized protein (TIGR02246 family)